MGIAPITWASRLKLQSHIDAAAIDWESWAANENRFNLHGSSGPGQAARLAREPRSAFERMARTEYAGVPQPPEYTASVCGVPQESFHTCRAAYSSVSWLRSLHSQDYNPLPIPPGCLPPCGGVAASDLFIRSHFYENQLFASAHPDPLSFTATVAATSRPGPRSQLCCLHFPFPHSIWLLLPLTTRDAPMMFGI